MNINDLNNDCLCVILGFIELTQLSDCKNPSTLNNLGQCFPCYESNIKCYHLHEYVKILSVSYWF